MTALDTAPAPTELDETPPPAPAPSGWAARAWGWFAARRWPTFVVFAVLGLAATATSSPGAYIGDSRYEMYANPARRLAKGFGIWDAGRGLGRVREDLWVGINTPLALLRAVGLDVAWTERVWHAGLLALVATGVVAVLSLFRPRLGPEHLIAGFAAAFGVYSVSFLTPFSDIYLQFALAPWLLVVFTRGVTDRRPWRWAAAFALLVAVPGNVDVPGLVLAGLPLLPLAVYLVFIERRVRFGHLVGWTARAGALTVLVSAAVLAKLYLASGVFGQRLNDTEAVEVSFRASSWTESWRGLGNWLSYFRVGGELLKPQGGVYFSSALVVLCTLVPAAIALAYVWSSRWRPRLLFALLALTSLVLLVGAYPLTAPSPVGSGVLRGFSRVALLSAFRNTYKAGPGLVIGVSILFGCGVMAGLRRLRVRSTAWAGIAAGAVVVVLAVNALPFWTGGVYNDGHRLDRVPDYWTEATSWLDARPGEERALVAPMTSRTRYRWGWVGDDIFDAMLSRPHAIATGVPLSTPQAANLLEAVSTGLSDPSYRAGTLAPVLRRIGVRYVVLRNDLDWQSLGRPRPAAYDGLRRDPDLVPVATFGAPGTNTVARDDTSPTATRERALPPVEVLEVRDPGPGDGVRVTDGRPPAVVAGDGAAWSELAALGVLAGDRPIVYSGALEPAELQDRLGQGAPLYVTDTNRRRLRVLLGYEPDYSATLAADQDLDRLTQSLFPRPGSQSVAWFADAESIALSGPPRGTEGSTPWYRPANAFDRNPATVWLGGRNEVLGRSFLVQLRGARTVSDATIDVANVAREGDGVTAAVLRFSDSTEVPVDLSRATTLGPPGTRRVTVSFPARRTSFVELRITGVNRDAATAGLADVAISGLDLTEHVQLPDDAAIATLGRAGLATAMAQAPTTFVFGRAVGAGPVPEEEAVRRRFRVVGDRPYEVAGELRLRPGTSDQVVASLLGRTVVATGARRNEADPRTWAGAAVDGDPATAWLAPARNDEPLTLRIPRQDVRRVGVMTETSDGSTPVDAVTVAVGDATTTVTTSRPCPGRGDTCRLFVADLAGTGVESVIVRATPRQPNPAGKIRIHEVAVNDQRAASAPADDARPTECVDLGLRLTTGEGGPAPLPVRLDGTVGDLLAGRPVAFRGCEVRRLATGWHRFDSGDGSGLERLSLTTADVPVPSPAGAPAPAVAVDASSPTDVTLRYQADGPTTVLYQQSWAPGWEATVNGRALDGPEPYDTLVGWSITDTGPIELRLRYRGQRIYDVGLALSAIGVVLCGWLVLRRPRRAEDRP